VTVSEAGALNAGGLARLYPVSPNLRWRKLWLTLGVRAGDVTLSRQKRCHEPSTRSSQQQLRLDFEAYLDGFSPNVQEILEAFEFRNQIPRLSRADAIGSLIDMLSNPPYGKSWKSDLERMGSKAGMKDPRFVVEHAGDSEFSLVTRSSDGQMLFLANLVLKMKHETRLGSRIAEVHNGNSLFTGDAGEGESNIRRWIIENDWLEAADLQGSLGVSFIRGDFRGSSSVSASPSAGL
jgi:type I restriction-modification system DNA methylase subunit